MQLKKKEIIEILKKEILSLKLKPGTIISETNLAERFGLSRTPIRDILKQLSMMDYINIYPKKGNIVSYIDLESVEQIIYLRSTLEKEILKELSPNIPLKGLIELRNILDMQKDCIQKESKEKMEIYGLDGFSKPVPRWTGFYGIYQQFNVHYVRYQALPCP